MVGRIKTKLVTLLGKQGIFISPESLWTQQGSHRHCDGTRWGANDALFNERHVRIYSWDTMTNCIKHGIIVGKQNDIDGIEIHSNE